MAKATYDFPADAAFGEAARAILLTAFRKMMENAEGTRMGLEQHSPTEEQVRALHDMRVGSRRLRAALSVFGTIFPREDFRQFNREIGAITDALGAVRDFDVRLETLQKLQSKLPENEAFGIERLMHRQRKKRDEERKLLLIALERLEQARFEKRFLKALNRATPSPTVPEADTSGSEEL